ncbi:MAG: NAD(P)H-binding protein, partial [Planctomycetota bacterium]
MNTNTHPLTLVLGGTGKTGRRVAERLDKLGVATRIGSRNAKPAFDWSDRATWGPALEGVTSVYIAYYPDLAVPGAPENIAEFAQAALGAGARRLVLLSGRGEEEAQRAEEILKASGAAWTILRAAWFAQNFSEHFLLDAVRSGTVALPVSDVKEPFVDADDIADVAVAALTQDGHTGKLYELTGPRLMPFAEVVGTISDAAGVPVKFASVTPEQYRAGLDELGLDESYVSLVMYLLTTVLDGRNESLGSGVQQALG